MILSGQCKMNWNHKHTQDWQVSKSTLKERFKELLMLSQWTDSIFIVGDVGVEIKCHKLVLAVSSPVFEALFFGGLSHPPDKPIHVPDIEPHVFKMLLMYMYSDSLNLRSIEEAGGLLYAAKKYIMPQLGRLCLEYLLERTCIQTLWDVLAIAESLDEEELIQAVLKIMLRFGRNVWYNQSEYLSASMLRRLLDAPSMNMTEEELWSIALDWARKDCKNKEMCVTGQHLRAALQRENILEKIRFLIFTPKEFEKNVVETEILTASEVQLISKILKPIDDIGTTNQSCDLATGICPINVRRRRVCQVIWRCSREQVNGDSVWICSDQLVCTVASHNLVLVTGLEVPTRSIYSARECYPLLGNLQRSTGTYNEKFSVAIIDQDGNVLVTTTYDEWVHYDSVQVVTLDKEVWFSPNKDYLILFEIASGSYELCNLAKTVQSKGTVFTFKDTSDRFPRSEQYCVY